MFETLQITRLHAQPDELRGDAEAERRILHGHVMPRLSPQRSQLCRWLGIFHNVWFLCPSTENLGVIWCRLTPSATRDVLLYAAIGGHLVLLRPGLPACAEKPVVVSNSANSDC